MSAAGSQTSNTAVVGELTNNFLVQVKTLCSSQAAALLLCDLKDVVLNNCDAVVECDNTAEVKSYMCDAAQTASAFETAFANAQLTQDQQNSIKTLTAGFPNSSAASAGVQAGLYASIRCDAKSYAEQETMFPLVQLTDCSGVIVTGLNSVDSTTRCNMATLSELVPPDPVPFLATYPAPIWDNALVMTGVGSIAAIMICIAILAAVAIANPAPVSAAKLR